MKGTISVESELTKGSTFTCTLPLQVVHESVSPQITDPTWNNSRILIMEPEEAFSDELSTLLKSWNFIVDTIHTQEDVDDKISQLMDADNPYMLCFVDYTFLNKKIHTYVKACKNKVIFKPTSHILNFSFSTQR